MCTLFIIKQHKRKTQTTNDANEIPYFKVRGTSGYVYIHVQG